MLKTVSTMVQILVVQRDIQLINHYAVNSIAIHPVDNVTHPLNNWPHMDKFLTVNKPLGQ